MKVPFYRRRRHQKTFRLSKKASFLVLLLLAGVAIAPFLSGRVSATLETDANPYQISHPYGVLDGSGWNAVNAPNISESMDEWNPNAATDYSVGDFQEILYAKMSPLVMPENYNYDQSVWFQTKVNGTLFGESGRMVMVLCSNTAFVIQTFIFAPSRVGFSIFFFMLSADLSYGGGLFDDICFKFTLSNWDADDKLLVSYAMIQIEPRPPLGNNLGLFYFLVSIGVSISMIAIVAVIRRT